MNKIQLLVAASALTLSATSFASGFDTRYSPQGFDYPDLSTVAGVKKSAYDDQYVTLRGRLVGYLGHDHYEFADNTGSIEVELDDDYDWSFISKNELIEIIGEVDRDFLSTTIDIKRARSLERNAPSNHLGFPAHPGFPTQPGLPQPQSTAPVAPAAPAAAPAAAPVK